MSIESKPNNYLRNQDPTHKRKSFFNGRIVVCKSDGKYVFFVNTIIVKGRYKGKGYVGEYVELAEIRGYKIKFSDVMSFYDWGLSYRSPTVLIWKLFHNKFRKI